MSTDFWTSLLRTEVTFTHSVQGVKVGSRGTIVGVRTEEQRTKTTFGARSYTVLYLTVVVFDGRIIDRVRTTDVMVLKKEPNR